MCSLYVNTRNSIFIYCTKFLTGINIDFETDDPECPPKEVLLKYSEILTMAEKGFLKVISMETIKEHYDVPKVEIGGKE